MYIDFKSIFSVLAIIMLCFNVGLCFYVWCLNDQVRDLKNEVELIKEKLTWQKTKNQK